MPLLKVGLLITIVLGIGVLGTVITRYLRRRTIAAWGGKGVNDSLTPAEAALLVGLHPGTLLALFYHHLNRIGKVALTDETPITLSWVGPDPSEGLERSFCDAFDAEGRLEFEGTRDFLDALYETVNSRMIDFSGLKTALYYDDMAKTLWKEMLAGGQPEPAVYPWLLFLDANEVWDQVGGGEEWEELKAMHRVKEHFRADTLGMKEILVAARSAKTGFFRYRRDLGKDRAWVELRSTCAMESYR